jgi:hypothetical protein
LGVRGSWLVSSCGHAWRNRVSERMRMCKLIPAASAGLVSAHRAPQGSLIVFR